MKPKAEIYTPKRDDEHPHSFHMRSPPRGVSVVGDHCCTSSTLHRLLISSKRKTYYTIYILMTRNCISGFILTSLITFCLLAYELTRRRFSRIKIRFKKKPWLFQSICASFSSLQTVTKEITAIYPRAYTQILPPPWYGGWG